MQALKMQLVEILVIELIELKEVLIKSAIDVQIRIICQSSAQESCGVIPVKANHINMDHIFVDTKKKERKEKMEIEDHQEDIEIEEDLQIMIGEGDLQVMVVIEIEEEDHRVMEEIEDLQEDTGMIETNLQVEKETMIQQGE